MHKRGLRVSVLQAARQRIGLMLDECPRAIVSFSGGKDSTVMLHLVMEALRSRPGRRVAVLFIDLEAQYQATIKHVAETYRRYADQIEPYWVAVPLALRNAVSHFEPRWQCWEPGREADWVRQPPPMAVTAPAKWPWFQPGMEFEEFVEEFSTWYAGGERTACFVGIRSDESLNRYRTLAMRKARYRGRRWTTMKSEHIINAYPIYDWKVEDLWTYLGREALPYNSLYDRMHGAGLTLSQMRICQPYGDDQRKGLWLYHVIEPETWGRVVARVNNANAGALYAQTTGNILGVGKVTLPEGHTWRSFATLILESMPETSRDHFQEKIRIFARWWHTRGYSVIPDAADPKLEAAKKVPSWRRICKVLLRYDYWCKGLTFSQPISGQMKRVLARRGAVKRRNRAARAIAMGQQPEEHPWSR